MGNKNGMSGMYKIFTIGFVVDLYRFKQPIYDLITFLQPSG